ncbi:multisubunit Na+/H+ antiporter MnhE subunit [Halarchaeum rubridurum]|uniref:Multisubunit Na+/H+ antiporter MnhE subunit n=1 Tax=Halarchaeum rubridurum TaxID=489911 RepID=A0A8T4GNR6_9EURY|nr:hypothetical protein [Halarchaeum rubridurum]MBP1955260.1 multisubunit Na+/H+ antiporter MnhE subunit [Halarchaeum rubridurum]
MGEHDGDNGLRETIVTFLGEWQLGAILLVGSTIVGFVFGAIVGSVWSGFFGVVSVVIGSILAFSLFSYLLYG